MKIKRVILKSVSFDLRKIIELVRADSDYIALILLFICGLVAGTAFVCNSENYRYILNVFSDSDKGFERLLINGVFEIFIILTANFSMGLCLVGTPFICIMSVFEGIYISSVYSLHLYTNGYEGYLQFYFSELLFYVVLYALIAISQFFAVSMSQSLKLYYSETNTAVRLREYLIRYLIITIVSLVVIIIRSAIKCFI